MTALSYRGVLAIEVNPPGCEMQMVCDEAAARTDADDATSRHRTERVRTRVWTGTQHAKKGKKNGLGLLSVCPSLRRKRVQAWSENRGNHKHLNLQMAPMSCAKRPMLTDEPVNPG